MPRDLTFPRNIARFLPSTLMNHLMALYISIDIWLFHKANEIEDYLDRRRDGLPRA